MRAEVDSAAKLVDQNLTLVKRHLDWDQAIQKLEAMNQQAELPTLWDDPAVAQKLLKERESLSHAIGKIKALQQRLDDNIGLIELGELEGDESIVQEAEQGIFDLQRECARLQIETLLSGEADANNCFIEVNAGAGGTEAQDWTQMLARMYSRWAESKKYKIELIDENPGDEAGLKSITLKISGFQAYGWMKTESGVHRLVRISPFDSNARRHTSFASVWVYPEIDDSIDIVIEEKDLRIDTYRASGAGGQHVNKTESAIRITHLPTNIAVQCQNDRSQHRNKAQAMSMLKARLYELELRKREEAALSTLASKTDIGWGHQIRSYVLQPYQMVKDLRTAVEKGNAQGVLDGDIDDYLEAALAQRIGGN
ncbi:peptide chain release factor 2 [Candidatus Paracaedibacter acanthamoebae]|uniref:Peptide chain release factor 2 n=1 Tax=Candidatus Odyssella acanthamoebae TaxID=91604 RepID=A0A077AYP7_9PROT|nr:peptide chain release factor 2 [Candidatus Paracaedibacter acanthamoebae]AIK97129.1 peptide chain release factor 2 [Candidatus Paracaedibacter acanthamoebae]